MEARTTHLQTIAPPLLTPVWRALVTPQGYNIPPGATCTVAGNSAATCLRDDHDAPCLGLIDLVQGILRAVPLPPSCLFPDPFLPMALFQNRAWMVLRPSVSSFDSDALQLWSLGWDAGQAQWAQTPLPQGLTPSLHTWLYADPGSKNDHIAPALVGAFAGEAGDELLSFSGRDGGWLRVDLPAPLNVVGAVTPEGEVMPIALLRFHSGLHVGLSEALVDGLASVALGSPYSYRNNQSPNWSIEPTQGLGRTSGNSIAVYLNDKLVEVLAAPSLGGGQLYQHIPGGFQAIPMEGLVLDPAYGVFSWNGLLVAQCTLALCSQQVASAPVLETCDGKNWTPLPLPDGYTVDSASQAASDGVTLLCGLRGATGELVLFAAQGQAASS